MSRHTLGSERLVCNSSTTTQSFAKISALEKCINSHLMEAYVLRGKTGGKPLLVCTKEPTQQDLAKRWLVRLFAIVALNSRKDWLANFEP